MPFILARTTRFLDGNKHAALASALVFWSLKGIEIEDPKGPKEELYDMMIGVAGKGTGKLEIAALFRRLKMKGRRKK